MSDFSIGHLPQSSILYLYSSKEEIQIDPEYQRQGEVWPTDKRQLLIDSILNGFDIPKIYFHELPDKSKTGFKYAIIDGRQRLESIWSFVDGDYGLSGEFEYLNDPHVKAQGLTYRELGQKYPKLKTFFDATSLTVVVVRTADLDLIEEMFSRLNEAVPLNAAEKRNALGGSMPKLIRKVAEHKFFRRKVRFSNKRYQHRDVAAKFLYLAHQNRIADTKKVYLDTFVVEAKKFPHQKNKKIKEDAHKTLNAMAKIFVNHDQLLKSTGTVVLYYLLFREAIKSRWSQAIDRTLLLSFEKLRELNRKKAEKDITKADYDLLEFDRLTQTPNDAYALELRLKTMKKHLHLPPRAPRQ